MAQRLKQTTSGDLDLAPVNGRGGPHMATGVQAAQAGLYNRISTQTGEWGYDFAYGLDWRDEILARFFDRGEAAGLIAAAGSNVADVLPIAATQVTIETDAQARTARIEIADVQATIGGIVEPVLVELQGI